MRNVTRVIVLFSLMLTGACTTTRIVPAPRVTYPQELFECPEPPHGAVVTQEDVAKFIVDLGGAYWICREKLKNVQTLVNK